MSMLETNLSRANVSLSLAKVLLWQLKPNLKPSSILRVQKLSSLRMMFLKVVRRRRIPQRAKNNHCPR